MDFRRSFEQSQSWRRFPPRPHEPEELMTNHSYLTRTVAILAAVAWSASVIDAAISSGPRQQQHTSSKGESDAATRGKYLVTAVGCNACHTPEKMGSNGPEP